MSFSILTLEKSSLKRCFEAQGTSFGVIISTGCLLWNKFVFITLYPILSSVVKSMENLQAPNKTSTRKDTCASDSWAECKEVPKLLGVQKILSWSQNPGLQCSTNHDRLYPQTVNENTLFHLIEVVSQILSCISLIRDSEDFHDMNRYISKVYIQIVNKIDFYWVLW